MDWRDRARRQAGVISREQLHRSGLGEQVIRGLVRRDELITLLPTVYTARPVPASFRQRAWAAALWSGGVISHHSAARLWTLPVQPSQSVHVIVAPGRRLCAPPGIRLHRLLLPTGSATALDGLRLTNRRATVLELLRREPYGRARDLFDRCAQLGLIDSNVLRQTIAESPGRTGNRQLRELVAADEPGAQAESERRLHQLLRRAGLPGWVPQYRVRLTRGVAYIDVAFAEQMVAIEVDGRRTHDEFSDRFEGDRTRQNELTALGWRVLRFTWRNLTDDPHGVIRRITELLEGRPD